MPLAVDNLNPESSRAAIMTAIQKTIEYLMKNEGKDQKAAAGQAYAMAEKAVGKKIGRYA